MITNNTNPTLQSSVRTHLHRDRLSQNTYARIIPDKQPITIRHAEIKDTEGIHQLLSERQIIYWTSGLPFTPTTTIQKRFAEPSEGHYTLVACAANEIVGMVSLSACSTIRLRHLAHLGPMAVRGDWQGQGIGSQLMTSVLDFADHWLNLVRIELLVYSDNDGAIALYQKHGFVIEGTLRKLAFRAGTYADGLLMARLNEL